MNENVAASTARTRGLRHLVLAVGIAVLCALCIGLVGCGGPSPTDVTKQAIEAVKAQDTDALAKVYAGGAANISTDMFASTSEGEELADSSDLTDKDKSATATVSLEKQDGNWVVQPFDGDFYNALTGGAYDLSNNMQKSFGSNS